MNLEKMIRDIEKITAVKANITKNEAGLLRVQTWLDKDAVLEVIKGADTVSEAPSGRIKYFKKVSVDLRSSYQGYCYQISVHVSPEDPDSFKAFHTHLSLGLFDTVKGCIMNFIKYSLEDLEEKITKEVEETVKEKVMEKTTKDRAAVMIDSLSGLSSGVVEV